MSNNWQHPATPANVTSCQFAYDNDAISSSYWERGIERHKAKKNQECNEIAIVIKNKRENIGNRKLKITPQLAIDG